MSTEIGQQLSPQITGFELQQSPQIIELGPQLSPDIFGPAQSNDPIKPGDKAPARHNDNATPEDKTSPTQNLSEQMFANPVDFLTTLRSIMPDANKQDPNNVTLSDLTLYAIHGPDAKGRAAADIAVQHYDQLRQLAYLNPDIGPDTSKGLSTQEIDLDTDLLKEDVQKDLPAMRLTFEAHAAVAAVGSLALGAMTAAGWAAPPLSYFAGTAAGLSALLVPVELHRLHALPKDLQALEVEDRQTMASWQGVGHSTPP